MKEYDVYKQLLRDAGLKATKARIKTLCFLENKKKPVSVDDIKKEIPDIDKVTIYRMTDSFLQKGIVRSLRICDDRKFFELAALPHHHHIVCKKCGLIEDIRQCDLPHFVKKIESQSNRFARITEHVFELSGLCKKCL